MMFRGDRRFGNQEYVPILKDYLEMICMKFESVVQQYCIGYGCHASFSLKERKSLLDAIVPLALGSAEGYGCHASVHNCFMYNLS